jgi:hypothetical protein
MSSSRSGCGSDPDKKMTVFFENLKNLEDSAQTSQDEITRLTTHYEGEVEKLNDEIRKLSKDYDSEIGLLTAGYEAKIELLNREIIGLNADYQSEIGGLKDNIRSLERKNGRFKNYVDELSNEDKVQKMMNATLNSENQSLKAEIEELKKRLATERAGNTETKRREAEARRLEEESREKECSICMENPKDTTTSCNHCFCKGCITEIIRRNKLSNLPSPCPICRSEISEKTLKPINQPKAGGGRVQNSPSAASGGGNGKVQNSPSSVSGGGNTKARAKPIFYEYEISEDSPEYHEKIRLEDEERARARKRAEVERLEQEMAAEEERQQVQIRKWARNNPYRRDEEANNYCNNGGGW